MGISCAQPAVTTYATRDVGSARGWGDIDGPIWVQGGEDVIDGVEEFSSFLYTVLS